MEPSFYSEQIERMQKQLSREKDPATAREMRKTLRHFHRELRRATRHRQPWYGLKRNLILLVLLFFVVVLFCVLLEWIYGWKMAATAFAVGIALLIIGTVTVFLAMKLVPPDIYAAVLRTGVSVLPWVSTRGEEGSSDAKELEAGAGKVLEGKAGRSLPPLREEAEMEEGKSDIQN